MAIGRGGGANESLYRLKLDNSDYVKGLKDAQTANGAFEAGAANTGRKLNQFGAQFTMMGNQAKASFAQVQQSTGSATEKFAKLGMAVGAASMAFQKYIALLKSGTGEGARAIERLESSWDKLIEKIGTSESNAFRPLIESMDGATTAAGRSAGGIEALGLAAATATNPVLGLASALMHLASVQGSVGGEAGRTPFSGTPVPDAIDVEGMVGEGAAGQSPLARLLAHRRQRGLAGLLANGVHLAPETPRQGRGGGGAGGADDSYGRLVMEQYNAQIAAQQAYQERVLTESKVFEERRIAGIKAAADAEKAVRLGALESQLAMEQAARDAMDANRVEQRRLDDADRARRKQEQAQTRSDAMAYAGIVGEFAEGVAGSHAASNWIKAGTETLDAILSIPNYVEVARHAANAVLAGVVASQDDSRAGKHKSRGPLGIGGSGGGSGGGGSGIGAGGFAPGAGAAGGGGPTQITINQFPRGPVIGTPREMARYFGETLGDMADAGVYIPDRAIRRRR